MSVFLDSSSTTRPFDEVILCIADTMKNYYGNASSSHVFGFESEQILRRAKMTVLNFLHSSNGDVFFTSGGTESNNLAIFGSINVRSSNNIVTTMIEHFSVLNPIKKFESLGARVKYLKPDSNGNISIKNFENNISEDTSFISIMHVNNETGEILPIKEFSNIIGRKCPDAVFHVDAVQSFGKLPISVNELGIDLLSASSHKIHGPRGLGILYVSERTKINPIFLGGGQQKKIRPGTEPVCLIAGFEKAIELCDIKNRLKKIERLNSYCRKKLNEIVGVNINSSKNASPYIINISVFGIKSEVLINFLSERGIYVSGSSACSKNKQSHVLKAMSLPKGFIESAIRISFSKFNTLDDIDVLVDNLKEALKIFSR